MSRFLVICWSLVLVAISSFAQQEKEISRQVFATAEQLPSFPGGIKALQRFMDKHLEYPGSAVEKRIEGQVILQFVVEPDGRLSGMRVLQSLDPDCDREALRVAGLMPRWDPGMHQGALVAVYYILPVSFRLH